MIEIKINSDGMSSVKMSGGSLKKLTSEAFLAIEAVYAAFDEHGHEGADAFKLAFYNAAKDKKFFNWNEDEKPCKAVKLTREQKLMEEFMQSGLSEDTARGLVDLAKQVVDALGKAAEEVCDEDHD